MCVLVQVPPLRAGALPWHPPGASAQFLARAPVAGLLAGTPHRQPWPAGLGGVAAPQPQPAPLVAAAWAEGSAKQLTSWAGVLRPPASGAVWAAAKEGLPAQGAAVVRPLPGVQKGMPERLAERAQLLAPLLAGPPETGPLEPPVDPMLVRLSM